MQRKVILFFCYIYKLKYFRGDFLLGRDLVNSVNLNSSVPGLIKLGFIIEQLGDVFSGIYLPDVTAETSCTKDTQYSREKYQKKMQEKTGNKEKESKSCTWRD